MQPNHWLPLTEYALRSGMSISTLRRKIKSNSITYKMEDGRYLIRMDDFEEQPVTTGFASSDAPVLPVLVPPKAITVAAVEEEPFSAPQEMRGDLQSIRAEMAQNKDQDALRWRALEARVAGIAKKLEFYSEQMAELKMLVKIFEEKLDGRL